MQKLTSFNPCRIADFQSWNFTSIELPNHSEEMSCCNVDHNVALNKHTLIILVEIGLLKFCQQEIGNVAFSARFWTQIGKFGASDGAQETRAPGVPHMF